jgi:hypothetical protein
VGEAFRACPKHYLALVERSDRTLGCPRGHRVSAWLVIVNGHVIGAGRFDYRNTPGEAWLVGDALPYVTYEAHVRVGPSNLHVPTHPPRTRPAA